MSTTMRVCLVTAFAVCVAPSLAYAQDERSAEVTALAERQRGIELLRGGHAMEAAASFEQSLSLVESPNTRLDLGRAFRAMGRPASAWQAFDAARGEAAGLPQYALTERAAASEAADVAPHVPRLELHFRTPPPEGSVVRIGANIIPATATMAPIPVDPGATNVRLEGPNVRASSAVANLADGQHVVVQLPVVALGHVMLVFDHEIDAGTLEVDGVAAPFTERSTSMDLEAGEHRVILRTPAGASAEHVFAVAASSRVVLNIEVPVATTATSSATRGVFAASPRSRHSAWPVVGAVIAGSGVALAAGGLASWLVADDTYHSLAQQCGRSPCTDGTVASRAQTGQTLEGLGIGLMTAGAIAAATGITIFLGTRHHEASPRFSAFALPTGAVAALSF